MVKHPRVNTSQLEQAILRQNQTLQLLQPITDGLASGIADFFTAIIDGSKSAEEAFVDMLRNIGQALIQQAAVMIAQYVAIGIARRFAGLPGTDTFASDPIGNNMFEQLQGQQLFQTIPLPGKADGGPVTANRPYIIGERGPELFVPNNSGTVVPNEALARYNGGNESMSVGPASVSVNYNVTEINDMRFVTEDQFQAGMASAAKEGAKAGEGRVLATLRNRRSVRKSVGL